MKIKFGVTRIILLTKNRVFKIPSFRSWKFFLMGLLANMQEKAWWEETNHDERLCPVLHSIPGGFLIIMPRAKRAKEPIAYDKYEGLPLDPKVENFGYVRGKIVLIDYGS